jgi:hypothetical protein
VDHRSGPSDPWTPDHAFLNTNKDRDDGRQLGATSAVLYQAGRERRHEERVLGETVTDSDTLLRSLHAGFDALTHFLENITTEPSNFVTLALPSGAAVNRALDASPHEDQETSISILRRLGIILESHPNTNIVIIWLPRDAPFEGFQRAKELALDAIRIANPTDIIEPQTINSQKEKSKDAAIAAWATKWHQSPHTSKAYQTALTTPPDGKPHHTFHAAQAHCAHKNR